MRLFLTVILVLLAHSCVLIRGEGDYRGVTKDLKVETVLPKQFTSITDEKFFEDYVTIPEKSLFIAKTTSAKTELRDGPGVNYRLKDDILDQDLTLLVFQSSGSWRFVVEVERGYKGWVHRKAISQVHRNRSKITVQLRHLPALFAVTNLNKAYTYPNKKKISAKIPKGSMFLGLNITGKDALVWIKETNSVVWLPYEKVF